MVISKGCGSNELYCIILRGISNTPSTPFLSVRRINIRKTSDFNSIYFNSRIQPKREGLLYDKLASSCTSLHEPHTTLTERATPWTADSIIHQFILSPAECSQDTQITAPSLRCLIHFHITNPKH